MKNKLYILLFLAFLFSGTTLWAQQKATPKAGEGISSFLLRHNRSPKKYYDDFIELNKQKLGKNNVLKVGVTYVIPPIKKSPSENTGTKQQSPKAKSTKIGTTINEPLFGKQLANVKVTSNRLAGACFYVVSGHGGPDPGAIGKVGKYELHEDEYAYDIALRLARNLMQEGAEVRIIIQDAKDGIRDDSYLSLSGKIEGLYREEELEIPYKALRECCTNALCHRLYHRPGSSVGIAIYDDRVEIENSGTFPPDITMEKLLSGHNSEPQNLIIANVLYKSEVLESWGRGIGLMISECRRVGIPDPEFHTDGNSVWVVFRYTRKAVGSYPTVTPQSPDSYPTVTPQVGKVLSAIGNQTLSTKDVMEMIGLKDKSNFLELYLYPAIRLDLVEPIYPEKPKHPRQKYRLTEKGLDLIKNK